MRMIKIFVSSLDLREEWNCQIFKDFESLHLYCTSLRDGIISGIIHVGFENIDYRSIGVDSFKIPGLFYASESAYRCLEVFFQFSDKAIRISSQSYLYAVTSGLGYIVNEDDLRCLKIADPTKQAGQRTFHEEISRIPETSIRSIIDILPQSIKSASVKELSLSIRSENVFNTNGISEIGDIGRFTDEEIWKLRNLGRKSFSEIRSEIIRFATSEIHINQPLPIVKIANESEKSCNLLTSPSDKTLDFSSMLDPRELEFLERRTSGDKESRNLRAIGENFSVSHERVRQIIDKGVMKITKSYAFKRLRRDLSDLLKLSSHPIPVGALNAAIENGWNISHPEILPFVFNHIRDPDISTVDFDGITFYSDIPQSQTDSIIESIIGKINETFHESKVTKAAIEEHIVAESGLRGKSLKDHILQRIITEFEFSCNTGDRDQEYVLGKSGMPSRILAILESSSSPLHYSEIYARYILTYGEASEKSIHAVSQKIDGVILFSRGTFGLEKHFTLSSSQVDSLCKYVLPIMLEDSNRQWHTSEIYRYLVDTDYDIGSELSLHLITEALKRSDDLTYIGRNVFVLKSSGSTLNSRIQIHQAIEALLISAGTPLTSEMIRTSIQADRGLGFIFQIMPSNSVIKISEELWGLYPRDVELSEIDIFKYVNLVKVTLEMSQRGVHISEIPSLIRRHGYDPLDSILILSLCQRHDKTIKVSASEYVYMEDWGETRRKTPIEAIREIFSGSKKWFTGKEIHAMAELILGREFLPGRIYGPLSALNIVYDEESGKWTPATTSTDISDK